MDKKYPALLEALRDYSRSGIYPMHMPGHKRNGELLGNTLPWELDITEIGDFDNLHSPTGILADLGARAAKLWGSEYAFPLVGGSTVGILAAIYACTHRGGKALIAANCHQSVYHAVELCGLSPVYLYPAVLADFGICGSVSVQAVERALEREPDIRLAVVTSPTYEGVISNIAGIAGVLHKKSVPLLVDEAHGAHLGLYDGFPPGALRGGADIAVHSLHKTLPALTQTAMLHIHGGLVSEENIRRALSVFQTSSPSYPLLASIDNCIRVLDENGPVLFGKWLERLVAFSQPISALEHLRILGHGKTTAEYPGIHALDPCKLIMSCRGASCTGIQLAEELLANHGIQLEMAMPDYALAMTSVCDTREGMSRLANALLDADKRCVPVKNPPKHTAFPAIKQAIPAKTALELPGETVPLSQSAGRTAGEYIRAYPPGVPLLVPGQIIGNAQLEMIKRLMGGFDTMPEYIRVVKPSNETNSQQGIDISSDFR